MTLTACPPHHVEYPSAEVANNAVELHHLAAPYCGGYVAFEHDGHWHVGHPDRAVGNACKAHPTHRAMQRRIEKHAGLWRATRGNA